MPSSDTSANGVIYPLSHASYYILLVFQTAVVLEQNIGSVDVELAIACRSFPRWVLSLFLCSIVNDNG